MIRRILSVIVLLHVLYQPPSQTPHQRSKSSNGPDTNSTASVDTTPADSSSSMHPAGATTAQSCLQVSSFRMHSCWRLCLVLVLTRLYLSELSGRVVCPCAGSAIAGSSHLFADKGRSPVSLTVQDEPQTSDSVCLSYTTRGTGNALLCRALAAIPLLCVSTGKCIVVHRVRFFKDQRNETCIQSFAGVRCRI